MYNNHLVGLPETLESLDDDDPNIKPIQLGSISAYETRLLQALREHPDRMEYWVKKGRIDKNHKFLLELYSKFFEILAGYGINYWLDFGSLLGYCRHHGIFPWEYDMDIGILADEHPKVEAIAEALEKQGSEWGFKWHTYEDWDSAPDYVFYNKNFPEVFCDLTLYNNDNGTLKCYRPEWNYPEYSYEDVFPTRKVVIFGQPALIPQSPEKVLKLSEKVLGQITLGQISNVNRVKWMQYDPIPFLLCQLYNPKFTQLLCTYSLKSTPKFKTLIQLQNSNEPKQLTASDQQVQNTQNIDQIIQSITISGENSYSQIALDVNLIQYPIHFQNGEQNISLKNTQEIQEMVFETPESTKNHFEQFELVENHTLLTLEQGEISLVVCPGEYKDDIKSVCKKYQQNCIQELLYHNDHALWGKMYQVLLTPGDSLYIPKNSYIQKTAFGRTIAKFKKFKRLEDSP